jgi:hypothetical protein
MADTKGMDDELQVIARGIVQGSSREVALQLSVHDWKNPVVKILLEAMSESGYDNLEDVDLPDE